MKYINLHYPAIDLETKFRLYLSTQYLPYLSNHTALQSKFERYKDNPGAGINAFLDYQNGINLKRLYMLIDSIYNPIHRYDTEYEFTRDLKVPYENKMSTIQQSYLSMRYRKLYLNFCFESQIIQTDNSYFTASESQAGGKSKGYRINPKLYAASVQWNRERFTIPESIYNNYTGKNKTKRHSTYPDHIQPIRCMMQGWNLDVDAVPTKYRKYAKKYMQYKNARGKFVYSGFGQRIYTAEGGIKKELREYLYHSNNPEAEYKQLEISNCHAYSLSILLLKQKVVLVTDQSKYLSNDRRFKAIEHELNCLNEFIISMRFKKSDELIKDLAKLIDKGDSVDNFDSVYKSMIHPHSEWHYNSDLVDLFNSKDAKYLLFTCLACSGLIYDVLSYRIGMNRKEFKGLYSAGMNQKNKHFEKTKNKAVLSLKIFFRSIYDFIIELKSKSHKNYFHQNTAIESKIMIEYLSTYLIKEGVQFINLHDGIIIPESKINDAKMKLEFQKLYPLEIPIKIENI